jgi:hypothetical protein
MRVLSSLHCPHCVPLHAAGGLTLPETPNSLIERGHLEQGRDVLQRIRGTENIQVLCRAVWASHLVLSGAVLCPPGPGKLVHAAV